MPTMSTPSPEVLRVAAMRAAAMVVTTTQQPNNNKRKRTTFRASTFNYADFATALYRKHIPLDVRLDLQQWFTMVDSRRRGSFGCRDKRWLAMSDANEYRSPKMGTDYLDFITGAVGCALLLLKGGRFPHQSSMLEDMLVQELISTQWKSTPRGKHTTGSFGAIDDDRIAYVCTCHGCGKLVHLAPPTKWIKDLAVHPHPTNHFAWREGARRKTRQTNARRFTPSSSFPFCGTNPRPNYWQCSVHGNMREYAHPSGQGLGSSWGQYPKCRGRLCDLVRVENMWTWKTFVKFLVTDKYCNKVLVKYYGRVVVGSALKIQALWRAHFTRTYVVPMVVDGVCVVKGERQNKGDSASPDCVWWSAELQETWWTKAWFEFLVERTLGGGSGGREVD